MYQPYPMNYPTPTPGYNPGVNPGVNPVVNAGVNPAQYPVQLAPQFPTQVQIPTPSGANIPTPTTGLPATPNQGIVASPGPELLPAAPPTPALPTPEGILPLEQSYIENILRLNLGKMARVYMTYEYNPEWPAKVYTGIIDEAGRDHIILRDEVAGKSYLLLMVNLDWVEIEGEIEYENPTLPGYVQVPIARP
jgi:spore germination protein Q